MIIISFSSIMAIVWSLLLGANSIPFILLLIITIFIFVCVYISNNKINIEDIDKNKDHTIAKIELKEIMIINKRINGYVF